MPQQPLATQNLEKRIQDAIKERNFESASIEQCKEQLRDAYMNFRDLQDRCTFDIKGFAPQAGEDPDTQVDARVLYFKPDTFLLDDAEKQRQYRTTLLKRIGTLPKPEVVQNLGDEMHRSMCQSVADQSNPKLTKKLLLQYFKRRQYKLQHLRYKVLCRWAHHTLTSEQLERIGPDATLIYGKLQYSLEQAISRVQRLSQEDGYDSLRNDQRPSTKVNTNGGALYVENVDIAQQTLVRADDIEVFVRGTTYRNKVNKVMNKFLARLKWVALQSKNEIYEKAVEAYFTQKQSNLARQKSQVDKVRQATHQHNIMTPDLRADLDSIISEYHCVIFQDQFQTNVDQTLHGWRATHETVPRQVFDRQLLTIKTLELAAEFGIGGDIWFDKGFAFSYQVSGFFPIYFQKQVIKAQFSLYDAFGAEIDSAKAEQFKLQTMAFIDQNIFRDVTTQPSTVPTSESLQQEFKNQTLRILRLHTAVTWLPYVVMEPTPCDWQIQQQALLCGEENVTDSLLEHAMTFLDMHDLATINRILEDSCNLHQENVAKLQRKNPHNQVIRTATKDSQVVDLIGLNNSTDRASQIQDHLLSAVQDKKSTPEAAANESVQSSDSLRVLPSHLLSAYYTLRFIKSRDAKTRILYTLNYFRSVQKRIAIDLREFGTRDRIDGSSGNPFIQSQEANMLVVNQINLISKRHETQKLEELPQTQKMTVFDSQQIQDCKDMASVRFYKLNGTFNTRVFKTCPGFSKFHTAHGEPLIREQPEATVEDGEPFTPKKLDEQAVRLLNRIDSIELNETQKEVYVKDDMGVYLMYDCSLQDMACVEQELLKVGSWYIHKSEVLQNPSSKPIPYRDRQELLQDLLVKEADFQFQKVKLCQVYMECYEHVADPLEQQRLMQILTDLMARRPRLNLQAGYFADAYDAEIECLKRQFDLTRQLVDLQISLEKTENKRLQDAHGLSYTLAKEYARDKWKYQSVEALLEAIVNQFKAREKDARIKKGMTQAILKDLNKVNSQSSLNDSQGKEESLKLSNQKPHSSQDAPLNDGLSEQSLDESDVFEQDQNQFSALLGLPQISLESIYQQYKENDLNVLQLMREHNNFVEVYEGYPEYLTMLTHGSIMDKNRIFKPNQWSQETGCLDFYDTLDFIEKFYAITQAVQAEIYDSLKPWDRSLMTFIDTEVCGKALEELRKVIMIHEGSIVEYSGREYVEDESVVGNSDKAFFYAKEMVADLTTMPKSLINPFCAAKLDVQSIFYFDFPKTERSKNKYTLQSKGVWGAKCILEADRRVLQYFSKGDTNGGNEGTDNAADLISDVFNSAAGANAGMRNLQSPCLLVTYCNMMEFLRLRQEIIMAASETAILTDIYKAQCKQIGQKLDRVELESGIIFEGSSHEDNDCLSYLDEGPAHHLRIGLAANEFDSSLLSNFNFRNPDSFKLNLLDSGLEEVRQVLFYQILQKQLLITATRTNEALMESYAQAISELTILKATKACLPNSMINYPKLMNRGNDCINLTALQSHLQQTKSAMSSTCQQAFYLVPQKKNQSRSQIVQEYAKYKAKVQSKYPDSPVCVQRVMRCFRAKLMNQFITKTITEVHLDAQKIQAVQACKRLRVFNRFFEFDPEVIGLNRSQVVDLGALKYESSPMLENFPFAYLPEQFRESDKKFENVTCIKGRQIVDYFGIPSSLSLLLAESSGIDDLRVFRQRSQDHQSKSWPQYDHKESLVEQPVDLSEPEAHLKRLLPSFTQKSIMEQLRKSQEDENLRDGLDYDEAMGYSDSSYGQIAQFYIYLERIMSLEWFIQQLSLKSVDSIQFQHAMDTGLLFYKSDEFDQRTRSFFKEPKEGKGLSQRFYFDQIVGERQKRNIAIHVQSLGTITKNFITQYLKTSQENRSEFLHQYTEFRYQQIVGALNKIVHDSYMRKDISRVMSARQAIARITLTDHVKVLYMKPNNFSVNKVAVTPSQTGLEPGCLIDCGGSQDDFYKFQRLVQPILNEKQLEPPQVTLFQSLFQSDPVRRLSLSQYAGQVWDKSIAFRPLQSVLLDLSSSNRQQIKDQILFMKLNASEFMENVHDDKSLKTASQEDVYSLSQIMTAKKYVNEVSTAQLLKNALICWLSNSQLPETIEQFQYWQDRMKNEVEWKCFDVKDEIGKKLQLSNSFGAQMPTKEQLQEKSDQIERLASDNSLPTVEAVAQRQELIKTLREEFAYLKKRVIMDDYFTLKAHISVYGSEIERLLIEAAVKVLDAESLALAKCFMVQVPQIQYHIHPFQQFAATLFDQVDPNTNTDITNKVLAVQQLLTRTRNRSTEVETLTSGPGIVITLKDFNEILIDFCKVVLQENLAQAKARQETTSIIEKHLREALHLKTQKIRNMEHRFQNIEKNLHSIISSRLFEKGNQMIYELDQSNRVLSIYKNSIQSLEDHLNKKIQQEQTEKFTRKNLQIFMKDQKFAAYKESVVRTMAADFAADQDRIRTTLKDMADRAKVIDRENAPKFNEAAMYTAHQSGKKQDGPQTNSPDTVIPEGFQHYPHCVCYQPDPKYPKPTLELAKLDMLSEQEARSQLAQMCILARKQRLLHKTKEMTLISKFQAKINLLESKQNSNTLLWTQLQEAEKREKVLKLELVQTQTSLAEAEKKIEGLQFEVRALDADRCRLIKFKASKSDRLKKLEERIKKIDVFDHIDSDKLIQSLTKKEHQLQQLRQSFEGSDSTIRQLQQKNYTEVKSLRTKLRQEMAIKSEAVEKVEQMKLELQMLEQNDQSVTSIWKKKCLDLFDLCSSMKQENEELRSRCQELIQHGIQLADNLASQATAIPPTKATESNNRLPELLRDKPMTKQQNSVHQGNVTPVRRRQPNSNQSVYVSLSKDFGASEETTDQVRGSSTGWKAAQQDQTPLGRTRISRSMMAQTFKSNQTMRASRELNDNRAVLATPPAAQTKDESELGGSTAEALQERTTTQQAAHKKNNMQLQNAVNRRQQLTSLHQDSLFNPQASVTSGDAVQKLKGASRFADRHKNPDFDLKGVSFNPPNKVITQESHP